MSINVADGNIGTGKSEFCKKLKKVKDKKGKRKYIVFLEPSEKNPHLSDYYKDKNGNTKKKTVAFTIEEYLINHRIDVYTKALKLKDEGKIVILDRCIHSSVYFIEANRKHLTDEEYTILTNKIDECNFPLPDKVIYLYNTVDKCHSNIKHRWSKNHKLECENLISKEYLKDIEVALEGWWKDLNTTKVKVDWSTFDSSKIDI